MEEMKHKRKMEHKRKIKEMNMENNKKMEEWYDKIKIFQYS